MAYLCRIAGLALAALALPLSPVAAATADPADDFLPSYVGPQAGDLDVLSIDAVIIGSNIQLSATLAANVGTTVGVSYVWGIDRGQGTARFGSLATGVLFDSVLLLRADGTGRFTDLLNGANSFNIGADSGYISISDSSIVGTLPLALIPSTGFASANYRYNFWPRSPGSGSTFISDFAPDNSTLKAGVVPEPAAWALMIAGFGLVGGALRQRRAADRSSPAL